MTDADAKLIADGRRVVAERYAHAPSLAREDGCSLLADLAERLDTEVARLRAVETLARRVLAAHIPACNSAGCGCDDRAVALAYGAMQVALAAPGTVAFAHAQADEAAAVLSLCAPTVCASDNAEGCGCLFHRARAVLDAPAAGRAIALADILRRAPGVLLALASPWGPLDADGRAAVRLLLDLHIAGYDPRGGWTEPQIANMRSALERR